MLNSTECMAAGSTGELASPCSPGRPVATLVVLSEAESGGQRALLGATRPGLALALPFRAE